MGRNSLENNVSLPMARGFRCKDCLTHEEGGRARGQCRVSCFSNNAMSVPNMYL